MELPEVANFSGSNSLIFFEEINNDFQYIFAGRPTSSLQSISIILQGGVSELNSKIVKTAIERYSVIYPNVDIILSTWDDADERTIQSITCSSAGKRVHVLLEKKPDYPGVGNTNLQIVSTMNGIRHAIRLGCKYVLKSRTDQIFGSFNFLEQMLQLQSFFAENIPTLIKQRIVVGSMGSLKMRPFSVSDFFSFGSVEDMLLMWSLPLSANIDNEKRYADHDSPIRQRSSADVLPMDESISEHIIYKGRAGEGYIVSKLLDLSGLTYSYDWIDSYRFIASFFIIIDSGSIVHYWNKYGCNGPHSKYKTGHAWDAKFECTKLGLSEYTFSDWLGFYRILKDRPMFHQSCIV
jgi:hypothetical protein